MSTNINISVGDNKLLEQARLQQAASRQAQLEREATQRLEAEADDAKIKALAAQGLGPDGRPLVGSPNISTGVDRRPAAFRFAQGYEVAAAFLTYPQFTGTGSLTSFTIETATKNQSVTVPTARPNPAPTPRTRTERIELFGKPRYWQVANSSDPNYIPLPISWTGDISGEINNFSQSRTYYTNPRLIAMPAGGQNMILFFSDESVDVECKVIWSATASATVQQTGSGATATRSATVTQTSLGETVTIYTPRFTLTEKCWIISPTAIRELSIPAAFESVVRPFASSLVVNPTYTPSGIADNTSWMTSNSFPETGVYNSWAGSNYHTWGTFLANQTTSPAGATNRFPLSSEWFDNVYNWGMASDNDVDSSISLQATWSTPAVFSMFGNGASIRSTYLAANPSTRYSYQHVLTTLLSDPAIQKPKEYLGFIRQSDTEARFDIAKTLPLNYYDYSNAEPLKKNSKGQVPVTTAAQQYTTTRISYAWDWGNPAYCKAKLLALGFTEADLTP